MPSKRRIKNPKGLKERLADVEALKNGGVRHLSDTEVYSVKSDGNESWYTVLIRGDGSTSCNCVAGQYGQLCKHVRRAKILHEMFE